MQRQFLITLILAPVLLIGGFASFSYLVATAPTPPPREAARPVLVVQGERTVARDLVEPIVGFGTARADRYARLTAEVPGVVVGLADDLRVGRAVRADELLVRIDDREYRQRLDRAASQLAAEEAALRQLDVEEHSTKALIEIAESELAIVEREYQRVLNLFEQGNAPVRERDLAQRLVDTARRTLRQLQNTLDAIPEQRAARKATRDLRAAEVEMAELDLERTELRAPFAGRIESVSVELGERLAPGQQVIALLDPDTIEVPVELPVSLRDRVQVGSPARLTLESNEQVVWSGRVERIAPAADERTRTFSLFLLVENEAQPTPLVPGMFVRAIIAGPTLEDVVTVPRGAMERGALFVLDAGVARRRPIEVARHLRDRSAVEGLTPGDIVIVSNLDALYDGAPVDVRLVEPERMAGVESFEPGAADATRQTRNTTVPGT